uniref:Uncharacterized protein n=1 Tax=Leersia perrieri TaxID=77586 RepID=A0A0D9WK38_9ORYZ
MRTITARNPHDSLSFSRRHFKWPVLGKSYSHGATRSDVDDDYMKSSEAEEEDEATMAFSSVCPSFHSEDFVSPPKKPPPPPPPATRQQNPQPQQRRKVRAAVSRLRSALLLELAAPTAALVREMASGLVRIALECERAKGGAATANGEKRLIEETVWRAYCNGKSCGYAVRRECGAADWRVLRALEPVSMGAGVIPAASCGGGEGDVIQITIHPQVTPAHSQSVIVSKA